MSLKSMRIKSSYTQEAVARELKTTRVTVSRWESGMHEPSFDTLRILSELYKCSIDDLVNPTQPRDRGQKGKKQKAATISTAAQQPST